MLDMLACAKLIQQQGYLNQSRYKEQKDRARFLWLELVRNQALQESLRQKSSLGFTVPLDVRNPPCSPTVHYAVCGIDGSQIYPDRHEGFAAYLINIGTAHFVYSDSSCAILKNRPYLFSDALMITPELVNAQRTDYELRHAVEAARHPSDPLILFDGALMFWHLQTSTMQEAFLQSYLDSLDILHNESRRYLGYISASHSSELVTLLHQAAEILSVDAAFDQLVDRDIMELFLLAGEYTQIFRSVSSVRDLYPAHLRPCFFYLHVGSEIARIELPEYMATDGAMVKSLVSVLCDHVKKGYGYPVALSEAHEQAVVKAADRDFFYTLLQMHYQQKNTVSLKLAKKRQAAI